MNPQKEKENLMNTKIITTSKNILILLLVLLSYALQSPAAKQQAELARYNQLGDAALLAKGKELAKNGKDKLALNCFELLQSRETVWLRPCAPNPSMRQDFSSMPLTTTARPWRTS